MKISEVNPDLPATASSFLSHLEVLIHQSETLTPNPPPNALSSLSASLHHSISRLASLAPFPEHSSLLLWKLSFRLWNSCVDIHNSLGSSLLTSPLAEPHASLRQAAADLLALAGNPPKIPSPEFKTASFFHKTGVIWHDLRKYELAAKCFEKATDLIAAVPVERVLDVDERGLLLGINLARARTAWEVEDRSLAVALLNRARSLLFGAAPAYKELAEAYLQFGKVELAKCGDGGGGSGSAGKMLDEALDLCEKGVRVGGGAGEEGSLGLGRLKGRVLRFLAAERLQAGDFDGVLRCVRVLREGGEEEEHPSVGFVAMRAWVGTGRVAEAEKELRRMVMNKGVPENVCVSAAEVFLGAAGVEAAKGVLMGLVGRCRLGAAAALRVVQRVVEGGGGGRARVVAELVCDERVVGVFAGADAAKERGAMHTILWNYAAEHFRSKDYEIAAELFEKSMLYLKHDEENRPRRANCYRVLCLCHLGLSQLDRAQEFINEAEKLQPTINCAFLKFKVYLQKGAEKEAIDQIEAIIKCIDFNPEYLTLSTHEAMACKSIPVAIASLSTLLSLYSPGKTMPMPEVAVLRNIIPLLQRSRETDDVEILKYTRRARTRLSELGVENFFGMGAVGNRELNWFAAHSWNMGLKAANNKKYDSSVDFFEMAAEFYSAINEETPENSAMVCKALIITVAAMISKEEHRASALPDADIKKAMEMLDKASKILASPSIATTTADVIGSQPLIEPGVFFLHTFNTYQILGRLSEDPHSKQLHLIKSFVSSSKVCDSQNLLHLGLVASQGPRPNPEVANYVLSTCLSKLLASPSPDYQMVSLILRKLVGLTAFRGEKEANGIHSSAYEVYRQAYRIVVGLKNSEYPKEEGKWLAMTAWNRSGVAVRLGQLDVAITWMRMGLDLAKQLTGMETYIAGMEECLTNLEKISDGGGSSYSGTTVVVS